MRFRVLIILTTLSGLPIHAGFGQNVGILTGKVSDGAPGIPLAGANVVATRADSASFGAVSDLGGRWQLIDVPPGRYEVSVTFVGYDGVRTSVDVVADSTTIVDVVLTAGGLVSNPVTITATRRPEKLLHSPASVSVLDARDLDVRTTLSTADHLKGLPAVDLITTGLNSSRVVIRGFNDNLAQSLLTMVDYRVAQVPSIRLTAMQLIPIGTSDVERIEVVSGPASALYGPNSANGVVHIITKSPFESPGTTVSIAGGEHSLFMGSLRHAGVLSPKVGYKVSAQYYTGRDFEFRDPVEVEARAEALAAGASADTLRIGLRDFDIRNLAVDARVDYRFRTGLTFIAHSGLATGQNIEISPTGAVQAKDALVTYLQTRAVYEDLFIQVFFNHLDSGDTYSLRTGESFKQNAGVLVFQAQHTSDVVPRIQLTYGLDATLTRPDTEGTTHGGYEDVDDVNEYGAYFQAQHELTPKLDLLGAARADYHNVVDEVLFSPRLALVFRPRLGLNLRATFNRAFQTPAAGDFFTDVLGLRDVFMTGGLSNIFGFPTATDLRAQGTPSGGFHFSFGESGLPQFRSPFAPLDSRGLTEESFIDLNDPQFTDVMWQVARTAMSAGLPQQLIDQGLLEPDQEAAVMSALETVLPTNVTDVRNSVQLLDLDGQVFRPVTTFTNIDALDVTRTETFEVGYKGLLSESIFASLDVYHTRVDNFVGPFLAATPNVFLNGESLRDEIGPAVERLLSEPENASARQTLLAFDQLDFIGNNDGDPSDEVTSLVSLGASQIPLGTVSFKEAFDPTATVLVRRNFGDVSLTGFDAAVTFSPSSKWDVGATLSYVSENLFEQPNGEDIALNAPTRKAGFLVTRRIEELGLTAQMRLRFVGGFPVRSDVYIGEVEPYSVADLSMNYLLPLRQPTSLTLTIQNVTDNEHREFVGVPEVGRVGMIRLTRSL